MTPSGTFGDPFSASASITLTCSYTTSALTPTIVWYKGDDVISSETNQELVISSADGLDSGLYRLVKMRLWALQVSEDSNTRIRE